MPDPSPRTTKRRSAAVVAARLAGEASRRLTGGQGRTISGTVFLRLARPRTLERVARAATCVLVSGTNGKTTTTALIARAAATAGPVATNDTGANLIGGIYSALLDAPEEATAVLEVDELTLPRALATMRPSVVALLNLSRDQLDRMHEVRRIAALWHEALDGFAGVVVANADDPLVVWSTRSTARVVWVAGANDWNLDATACPSCSSTIDFDADGWRCRDCELHRPPAPPLEVVPELALPGRCNVANANVALAVLRELGVPRESVAAWTAMSSVAGRYQRVATKWGEVRTLLAKNPAGWAETFEVLDPQRGLVIGLNSRPEDGADPSWIWDVPFERLAGRTVVCAGDRGTDLAVRLHTAGLDVSIEAELTAAIAAAPGDVDFVGNYSAFRDALGMLRRAG
jgi:UDP-N-acetylmuramyl tripeptide synthase